MRRWLALIALSANASNGGSGVAYPDTVTKTAAGISNVDSIAPKYAGYAAPQAARVRTNVEVTYKEIP